MFLLHQYAEFGNLEIHQISLCVCGGGVGGGVGVGGWVGVYFINFHACIYFETNNLEVL